ACSRRQYPLRPRPVRRREPARPAFDPPALQLQARRQETRTARRYRRRSPRLDAFIEIVPNLVLSLLEIERSIRCARKSHDLFQGCFRPPAGTVANVPRKGVSYFLFHGHATTGRTLA